MTSSVTSRVQMRRRTSTTHGDCGCWCSWQRWRCHDVTRKNVVEPTCWLHGVQSGTARSHSEYSVAVAAAAAARLRTINAAGRPSRCIHTRHTFNIHSDGDRACCWWRLASVARSLARSVAHYTCNIRPALCSVYVAHARRRLLKTLHA